MTAAIAPGPLPGLAPPATNAPPTSAGGTGQPVTGPTFAETVAAADAAQVTGGEPNAPPASTAEPSTNPASPADLLLLIAGALARLKSGVSGTGDGETKTDTPLPDRPAGAGVEQTDIGAMEALMGQLLLVRTNVEEPMGSGIATSGVEAVASPTTGATGDAAALLDDIAQMLQGETLVHTTTATTSVAADAAASADVAQVSAPVVDETTLTPMAETPQLEVPSVAASAAPAVLVAAPETDATKAGEAASERAATEADSSAAVEAVLAATDRPAEATANVRERAARPEAEVEAPTATTTPATAGVVKVEGVVNVTSVASTARAEAAGPVTVQLANTVQSAVLRGEHEVRLVLNPPELGRVEIHITQTSGGISVQMQAEHSGARDLIQQQLPVLHQALEARELRVDRLQVSHTAQGDAAQQSLDSRGFADQQRQQRDDAPEWSPLASFGMSAQPQREAARPRVTSTGGLDVMA